MVLFERKRGAWKVELRKTKRNKTGENVVSGKTETGIEDCTSDLKNTIIAQVPSQQSDFRTLRQVRKI